MDGFMLCEEGQEKILESRNHLFEEKFDGERAKLISDGKTIKVINRHFRDITFQFPEFSFSPTSSFEIDGEIIVPADIGNKDKPSTASRSHLENALTIRLLSKFKPALFCAFDICSFEGKDTTTLPLEKRKEILKTICYPQVKIIESYVDGLELWRKTEGNEGIVAKRFGSLYLPKRSSDWIKVKRWKEEDVQIVGFESKKREVSTFLIKGGGRVNCSLSNTEINCVAKDLYASIVKDEGEVKWIVENRYFAKIKYLYKAENGNMRFPVLRELMRIE